MNRHQVLTGAANYGDHCFAIGSVEGIHFTAYATGCDIVILSSDFQRVQIIPGAIHGNIQVTCLDCCNDTGKIAASYGNKVCIFEPTPLLHHDSTHKLDYQWYHTAVIQTECTINALAWNTDGSRLLTGGDVVQMWQCPEASTKEPEENVASFYIEVDAALGGSTSDGVAIEDDDDAATIQMPEWQCIWSCRPATTVYKLKFSPDGLLFATLGKADCLVKIWCENKKVQFPLMRSDSVSPKKEEINFSFIYIAHPRAVTGFEWRRTSKYMPRGGVSNMLITSCLDNICRVWCETILPEDGLVDLQQLDPTATPSPAFHTQRHRNRFMQRLHHIRNIANRRRRNTSGAGISSGITPLPSAQSEHDFHKFGVHPNSVAPGFHFHLAASINPETDIPLLPVNRSNGDTRNQFVVHWLNNKELHFTQQAEHMLTEMSKVPPPPSVPSETSSHCEDGETVKDSSGSGTDEFHASSASSVDNIQQVNGSSQHSKEAVWKNRRAVLQKSHSEMSHASDDVSVTSCHSMPSTHSMLSEPTGANEEQEKGLREEFELKTAVDAMKKEVKDDEAEHKEQDEDISTEAEVVGQTDTGMDSETAKCPHTPRELLDALRSCMTLPHHHHRFSKERLKQLEDAVAYNMAYTHNESSTSIIEGKSSNVDIEESISRDNSSPDIKAMSSLSSADLLQHSKFASLSYMTQRRVSTLSEVAHQASRIIRSESIIRKHVYFRQDSSPTGSTHNLSRSGSQHGLSHSHSSHHDLQHHDLGHHGTANKLIHKHHFMKHDHNSIHGHHRTSRLSLKNRCNSHHDLGQHHDDHLSLPAVPGHLFEKARSCSHHDLQLYSRSSHHLQPHGSHPSMLHHHGGHLSHLAHHGSHPCLASRQSSIQDLHHHHYDPDLDESHHLLASEQIITLLLL